MDKHELNRMFDGLAPDPQRAQELLRQILQNDEKSEESMNK